MKNISIIVVLFSFLCLFPLYPQDYYWYKDKQIKLLIDSTKLNITIAKQQRETELNLLTKLDKHSASLKLNQLEETDNQKLFSIDLESSKMYNDIVTLLKSNSNVVTVSPYFVRGENSSIGTSQFFYVQLHNINDYEKLKQFADKMNLDIVKQVPNIPDWYILSVTVNSEFNSVEMSNIAYETGLFVAVDPAFMFNFSYSCVNDPDFSKLWGLKNNTNPDVDIDVCDAWSIAEGENINVAVIDQGVDKTHNDLVGNISPLSFDMLTGTSPSVFSGNHPHGTRIAGIIAAVKNNNRQVVGVAPNSKIMSASLNAGVTSLISSQFASGIEWAWKIAKADVISCSWGDYGGSYYHNNGFAINSALLENTIEDALLYGRDGKGCVVVFAAGNTGLQRIDYPGNSHEDIIVVGAIDNNGKRAVFSAQQSSSYGTELDVVAPGNDILSTIPNNAVGYDGGTSYACPHVSGIAALVLSVNPYLTQKEVANIIEKTAKKISENLYYYYTAANRINGIWSSQLGYGLVNAYEAVKMAEETLCPPILTGIQPPPLSYYRLVECEEIHVKDATVPANTTLILDATNKTTINAGFKVETGARFIVK